MAKLIPIAKNVFIKNVINNAIPSKINKSFLLFGRPKKSIIWAIGPDIMFGSTINATYGAINPILAKSTIDETRNNNNILCAVARQPINVL